MNDLTITIPLSWLSFLTWSGFWAVWLYAGIFFLCLRIAVITGAMFKHKKIDRYLRSWRSAPLWKSAGYFCWWVLAWPLVAFDIAQYWWSQKP